MKYYHSLNITLNRQDTAIIDTMNAIVNCIKKLKETFYRINYAMQNKHTIYLGLFSFSILIATKLN